MKIKPESIYKIKLSGHQINLLQTTIAQAKINNSLSEDGEVMADSLYQSLEEDVEEVE